MDMWSEPKTNQILRGCSRIGLFDSGVGGLSVLKQLQDFAASSGRDMEFIYVGDTARCPYGNRTANELRLFAEEIVLWLNQQRVDAVIVACNTSASLALPYARQVSTVPVLDLIGPTATHVVGDATKIGVMATSSTVRSRAFSRAITRLNPDAEVVEIACPDLVPIIESGDIDSPETVQVLQKYVDTMKAAKVDTIILGCTHFPFLRKQIKILAQDEITIIDPAEALTVDNKGALKQFLNDSETDVATGVRFQQDFSSNTKFYVTGSLEQFNTVASKCLGQKIIDAKHLSLKELAAIHAINFAEQPSAARATAANTSSLNFPQVAAS